MEDKKVKQPCLRVRRREIIRKWCKRVNMAEILCTHVWKWKMGPVETILRIGGEQNDGGVNLSMIYCKQFCKCHNVPSVQ
jgi:hypothetical protein